MEHHKSNLARKNSTKKLIMAQIECALDEVIEQHSLNNKDNYSTCYAVEIMIKALCQSEDKDFEIVSMPGVNVPGASKVIR